MKKVMIATPAYDGRVHVPYAISLSETTALLLNSGVQVQYNITTSGSLLVAERNRILKLFMKSDATHLLCVDSDLGWNPQFVLKMLLADKEFINPAGIYCIFRSPFSSTIEPFSFSNVLKVNVFPSLEG